MFAALGAVATLLIPGLSVAGVPLAALSLGSLLTGRRAGAAAGAALAGLALVAYAYSPVTAGFVAAMLALVGPGFAWALKRKPALAVAGVATLAMFGLSVGSDAATLWAAGHAFLAELQAGSKAVVDAYVSAASRVSDPAAAKIVQSDAAMLGRTLFMLWPSDYLQTAMLTAVLSVSAVAWASARNGVEVNRLPRLAELDVSAHFVWPIVAGMFLLAAARLFGDAEHTAIAVAANLLLTTRTVFLAQGLGVASALMERRGVGRTGRIIGCVALVLFDVLFLGVTFSGVADIWLNFRRLPRDGGATPDAGIEGSGRY